MKWLVKFYPYWHKNIFFIYGNGFILIMGRERTEVLYGKVFNNGY